MWWEVSGLKPQLIKQMQAVKNQSSSMLKILSCSMSCRRTNCCWVEWKRSMNEWFRFPKLHTKKDSYILCFQTETEAFLLVGMLVCQKSWHLNSSATAPVPDIFLPTQMQSKKGKAAQNNVVNQNTLLVCQRYCRKETHTVSLAMYRRG